MVHGQGERMSWGIGLYAAGAFFSSVLLTALVRARAISRGVLDVPNQRSAHSVPVPRGGGAAIVFVAFFSFAGLAFGGVLDPRVAIALLGGGLAVATVGFIDDRRSLSAAVRLLVHLAAAAWALAWIGGFPAIRIGDYLVTLGPAGYVVGILSVTWALNLFNFMDGIDGIAASEAVFICLAWTLLTLTGKASNATETVALFFAAACAGFLFWNWAPAKIFMGDVGSGFVGYVIAIIALASTARNPDALLTWMILGAVFVVDATLTLLRRLLRRESPHQAHRSHAYQFLARKWGSHRAVTLAAAAVNLGWLLPNAWLATTHPTYAGLIFVVAYGPVIILAAAAGAGGPDAVAEPGR
jgi:Fuc2NAc and GlcNAc transferase